MMSSLRLVDIKKEVSLFRGRDLLVVIDENIHKLYPEIVASLDICHKSALWVCKGDESTKSFKNFESCLEHFIKLAPHRGHHLLAIGGGAVSDFAGFVASTLLRGISWSVIPTTLLSMIDASIGGKTAINSSQGKNLVGTFHLPESVLIDPDFLKTLPKLHLQSGLGELLKYAYLNLNIHNLINTRAPIDEIIFACARYKEGVTERDLTEKGERKFLNFGHSFGHAIEKIYSIPHGEAVFWGIYLILELYAPNFVAEFAQQSKLLKIDFHTPPWSPSGIDVEKIHNYLIKDKKKIDHHSIDLVLIQKMGEPFCQKAELEDIKELLRDKSDAINKFYL